MFEKFILVSFILFFQLIFVDFINAQNFEIIFGDDYLNAQNKMHKNDKAFNTACNYFKNDELMVKSIVFPELVRYNMLKDFFETASLKILYVENGSKSVDFSIGEFQMKPSFIEDIENEVVRLKLKDYFFINKFKKSQIEAIREERVDRLADMYWQLVYINCFVSIMSEKYKSKEFKSIEERLQFYASVYNTGINAAESKIIKNITNRFFPYGKSYRGVQYSYSDVSLYFYKKTKKQIN